MLKSGILNPAINSLLSRFRHTNMIVIADRGFPFWPQIETIDISLIDNVPTVLQVFQAIRDCAGIGRVYMAEEFLVHNATETRERFSNGLSGVPLIYEPHEFAFKKRVPNTVGLIRTSDTTPYGNLILVSA